MRTFVTSERARLFTTACEWRSASRGFVCNCAASETSSLLFVIIISFDSDCDNMDPGFDVFQCHLVEICLSAVSSLAWNDGGALESSNQRISSLTPAYVRLNVYTFLCALLFHVWMLFFIVFVLPYVVCETLASVTTSEKIARRYLSMQIAALFLSSPT